MGACWHPSHRVSACVSSSTDELEADDFAGDFDGDLFFDEAFSFDWDRDGDAFRFFAAAFFRPVDLLWEHFRFRTGDGLTAFFLPVEEVLGDLFLLPARCAPAAFFLLLAVDALADLRLFATGDGLTAFFLLPDLLREASCFAADLERDRTFVF